MINHYDNETRLTAILRCVVGNTADSVMLLQLGPARTREEIFISRALGKKPWAAIPPRTTLEMWLAFIAEDEAEPAPGSYTVRSCAESCIITYARRVKGATTIAPIFPPHDPYEIALAKLAGIIPASYGAQGRPWELLINQLAGQGPRENVTVIYGSAPKIEGDRIAYMQDVSDGPPSPTHNCPILPGLSLILDNGNRLVVYDGEIDWETGRLVSTMAAVDLGTLSWQYIEGYASFRSRSVTNAKPHGPEVAGNIVTSNGLTPIGRMSVEAADYTLVLNCTSHTADSLYIKDPRYTDAAQFKAAMSGVQMVYELAEPVTVQLSPAELQRARGCTKYLGVGAWKLCPGVMTVIFAQLTTDAATTHYDLAPSEAEGWSFEISVDGQTVTGATSALSVAAGDHSVTITATPAAGAATCYIHPTLYSEEATP